MLWQCDCACFGFGCIVAKWLVLSVDVEWVVGGLIFVVVFQFSENECSTLIHGGQ